MDAIAPTLMTRAEAMRDGLDWYFTGRPCPRGHITKRRVSSKNCAECELEFRRVSGKKNRAKNTEYGRKWLAANPDKAREYQRRDFEKNRDKKAGYAKDWRKRNVPKQRFYSTRRRAMEYAAIPAVPDDLVPIMQSEILAIYAECRTTQELTGIRHDVDHIFPIMKGGVHAPWNLRVILRSENQSKKDKWPDTEPLIVMWHGLLVSRIKETE